MSIAPAAIFTRPPSSRWQTVARVAAKPEVLISLAILSLIIRFLLVPNPLYMNDEYYYIKTAQLWHDGTLDTRAVTNIPNRGETGFPNSLFFAIYQSAFLFGDGFYAAAKWISLFFAAVTALAIGSVARRFMKPLPATGIVVLALWLPSTTYLHLFMPEALYECLVWLGVAALFALHAQRLKLAVVVLGACLGAAWLAKPNAIAVLAAFNLVIACLLWTDKAQQQRLRSAIAALLLVNVSFVLTGYLLNVLLTGHLQWDPMGKFYQIGLSKMAEVDASGSFVEVFARYLKAYVFVVLVIFSPALIAIGAGVAGAARRLSTADVLLLATAILGTGVLLLGSVKVGVNWERVYSNHKGIYSTRYMSVFFPLFVIAFFRFLPDALAQRKVRAWLGAGLALACLLLMTTRGYVFVWGQMRWAFWAYGIHPAAVRIFWAVMWLAILYYAFARAPRARVYGALTVAYSLLSVAVWMHIDFMSAQHGEAKNDADAARTVAALVRPESFDQGHVVAAAAAGPATRFMSTFPGIISMALTDPARPQVERGEIPKAARWVVFLAGTRPGFDAPCLALKSAIFCPLGEDVLNATR